MNLEELKKELNSPEVKIHYILYSPIRWFESARVEIRSDICSSIEGI